MISSLPPMPISALMSPTCRNVMPATISPAQLPPLSGRAEVALPLFGLYGEFPQYSPRSATEITIEDRINSCMTRSMNGQPLPPAAAEMQAIVAYIKFLSSGVPAGQQLPGLALERCRSCRAPPIQSAATRSTRADAPIATTLMGRACAAASLFRPRIHDPAAMGPDSFNDGAEWRAYHHRQLRPLQYASRHRLSRSTTYHRRRLGRCSLCSVAAAPFPSGLRS